MTDEPAGPAAPPSRLGAVKAAASSRWAALKERRRWVRHVVAAWGLMQRNNGNQYAAAITYFSFLALFPLLLLAVAVAGFVLSAHPAAEKSLFAHLAAQVPGAFGDTVKTALQTAIDNRSSVGVVGLVGVLLTGLGWIGNLRGAIDGVWGRPPRRQNFLRARAANLLVLGGLGLGLLISLGLTVVGTAVTDQLLQLVNLDSVPGVRYLLKVVGIALALAGDMVIFWWLLVRLPQSGASRTLALRGALLAAVGFEVLKVVGTYTIAKSSGSPTAGPFAGIVAVLVWIQLVARYMLFSCAWIATAHAADRAANSVPIVEPPAMAVATGGPPDGEQGAMSPATVGASLLGVGAAAGATAAWAWRRQGRAARRRDGSGGHEPG